MEKPPPKEMNCLVLAGTWLALACVTRRSTASAIINHHNHSEHVVLPPPCPRVHATRNAVGHALRMKLDFIFFLF